MSKSGMADIWDLRVSWMSSLRSIVSTPMPPVGCSAILAPVRARASSRLGQCGGGRKRVPRLSWPHRAGKDLAASATTGAGSCPGRPRPPAPTRRAGLACWASRALCRRFWSSGANNAELSLLPLRAPRAPVVNATRRQRYRAVRRRQWRRRRRSVAPRASTRSQCNATAGLASTTPPRPLPSGQDSVATGE